MVILLGGGDLEKLAVAVFVVQVADETARSASPVKIKKLFKIRVLEMIPAYVVVGDRNDYPVGGPVDYLDAPFYRFLRLTVRTGSNRTEVYQFLPSRWVCIAPRHITAIGDWGDRRTGFDLETGAS
jgi:hypothetical protein